MGVEIHNGQVLVDGVEQEDQPALSDLTKLTTARAALPSLLDPNEIARLMAARVQQGRDSRETPMETVNGLLQLSARDESGKLAKIVWTRFDVFQLYGLYSRKLAGESKT